MPCPYDRRGGGTASVSFRLVSQFVDAVPLGSTGWGARHRHHFAWCRN
ncbi:hypothetical protein [Microseira wollei]|nr:hypothetical protein [Microseira wollei]